MGLGCIDIGIRKFKFVAKTQILSFSKKKFISKYFRDLSALYLEEGGTITKIIHFLFKVD